MNNIPKPTTPFTDGHLNKSKFDLDLLRGFYMVAKAGSASKASQALGMTQPALSRQISLLERSIGAELFFPPPKRTTAHPTGGDPLRKYAENLRGRCQSR